MTVHAVHSTKYDGGLHYAFPLNELRRSDGLLIAWMETGRPMRSYRGDGLTRFNSLHYYWADRHYNVTVMWDPAWRPHAVYVNIATPASWDGGVVRFVDLDVDVMWRAGADSAHVEDEDEFELHRAKWRYPPELVARATDALEQVRHFFSNRWMPFSPEMMTWRPGQPPPLPVAEIACEARNPDVHAVFKANRQRSR